MKLKKIALLLAVLPALALADDGGVTIYGRISGSISSDKALSPTGSVQNVNDRTSRIGFKGFETLGSGLSAIWQVESRIHVDGSSSTDTLASRDTFVGLKSNDLGTIRLGYLSNYANLDMELFDITLANGASTTAAFVERADTRIKNAIRYDSPVWGGFSFTTAWGADETRSSSSSTGSTNNQLFNLGLSYQNSGFVTKFNYQTKGDARKTNDISNAGVQKNWWRLETGYIDDTITAIGGFQKITGYLGVSSTTAYVDGDSVVYSLTALNARLKANGTALTASDKDDLVTAKEAFLTLGYNIGAFTPYFEIAKGYDLDIGGSTVSKTGYKQYVVGTIYKLSKTTKTYLSYGYVNWGGAGVYNQSSLSLGLSKWF